MTALIRRLSASRLFWWGVVAGVGGSVLVGAAFLALDDDGEDSRPIAQEAPVVPVTTARPGPSTTAGPAPAPAAREADRNGQDDSTDEDEPKDEDRLPLPAPPAGPGALPDGQAVTCPATTERVSTAEQLQAALDAAAPGDTIELAAGTYVGAFVATKSGTADQPVFLCGPPTAVLDGEGPKKGYVLHLRGVQHWRVVGFTVRNGQKGVMADAVANSVIQGLTVEDIGDEAIHLRSASHSNAVLDNVVRRTGLRREKFGEGIYVGSATSNWEQYSGGGPDRSDYNLIQGNQISATTSEPIDIKEGTTGGRIVGNVIDGTGMSGADSLMDLKGNDWLVESNIGRHAPEEGIQTHRILEGWGSRNTIRLNTIDVDGDGNHFYVHDPDVTENRVSCDNRTGSGDRIRSNVDCVP